MDQISLSDIIKSLPPLIARAPRASKAIPILNRSNKYISLGTVIEESAKKYPKNTFIHFEDKKISYKAFNDYSNKLANYLSKQGIKKGDVVSLLFENRPEFLISAVAVVKTGAVAALLNPSQRGQVLLHSINLVKSKAIIVGEELVEAFDEVRGETPITATQCYFLADQDLRSNFKNCPRSYVDIAQESHSYSDKSPAQLRNVHRFDSCFYIYTSGTTGMPKASITNHERWLAAHAGLGHALVQLNEKDVFYCALPFYHATAMLVCWGTIIAGGSSFVLKRKFSVSEFWQDVSDYKVTAFGYVGELCRYLLNQEPSEKDKQHNIRLILGNGLRPSAWEAFKQRFNIERIIEFYGASEGNVVFINLFNLNNTIGLGSHNAVVVKYDKELEKPIKDKNGFMQKVDKGEAGLLIGKISKFTPFTGYTDKNQTQKATFKDVFEKGDQWFNTGDLVKNIGWHHYQFVDRLGDTFRWKGENVSTTELENICMQFEAIEDCIAYGVEIPETNGRIGMLTLCAEEEGFPFDDFLAYLKKNLPVYALPYFLRFKSSLDTTGTFKHKKSDLKDEAYHLGKVSDPLYVLLPSESDKYQRLEEDSYASIINHDYRF
jgi:citronellyl-CoA synthetase